MVCCPESAEKNKRMYIEVRYVRLTSTSLKESAPVFRFKKDGKNLSTGNYAFNLSSYLDNTQCTSTLTLSDLSDVLIGL